MDELVFLQKAKRQLAANYLAAFLLFTFLLWGTPLIFVLFGEQPWIGPLGIFFAIIAAAIMGAMGGIAAEISQRYGEGWHKRVSIFGRSANG